MFTELSTPAAAANHPEKAQSTPSSPKKRRSRLAFAPSVVRAGAAGTFVINRRRSDSTGRRAEAVIMKLAKWLPAHDLALIRWVYESKQSTSELARVRNEPLWVLQRHLRRLVTRILSDEFAHVAGKLESAPSLPAWPPGKRDLATDAKLNLAIARAVFIDGISMRRAAREARLSLHLVRRHCDAFLLEFSAKRIEN